MKVTTKIQWADPKERPNERIFTRRITFFDGMLYSDGVPQYVYDLLTYQEILRRFPNPVTRPPVSLSSGDEFGATPAHSVVTIFPLPSRVVQLPKYIEHSCSIQTAGWSGSRGPRVPGLAVAQRKPLISRPIRGWSPPRSFFAEKPLKPAIYIENSTPPENVSYAKMHRWLNQKGLREIRTNGFRQARYKRLLAKYEERVASYKSAEAKRAAQQEKADQRFARRMKAYAAQETRLKQRLTTSVCYPNCPNPQDNPYDRMKLTDLTDMKLHFVGLYSGSRDWVALPGGSRTTTPSLHQPIGTSFDAQDLCFDPADRNNVVIGVALNSTLRAVMNAAAPHLESFDNKVRRKISSKLKNQVMHVGNLIAERKQTFDMLQSTFKRIYKLIKLKRNIFRSALEYVKHPNKVANDILAFKFGAEPLAKEIMDLADHLAETEDNPSLAVRSSAGGPPGVPFSFDTPEISFVGTLHLSYVVKYRVESTLSKNLSQFGLVNPAEILWEVIPWSFVVDWFIPVGNYISALTSNVGISFETGTRKVRLVGSFHVKVPTAGLSDRSLRTVDSHTITGRFNGEMISREVLSDFPSKYTPPSIKNPWSGSHFVEVESLALQRMRFR